MIICEFEDGGKGNLRHVTVDSLVIHDGKILLVKRSEKLSEGGKWALPGGFMTRDENLIQAAKRETEEESGSEIKNLTLLSIKDSPNRPAEDRQNVSFVFLAEIESMNGGTDWETTERKWFDLDELPDDSNIAFDHGDDIKLYKKYLENKFNLPIID